MLECTLDYNFNFDKMSEEQKELFLVNWPFAKKHVTVNKETGEKTLPYAYNIQSQLLTLEAAYALQAAGIAGVRMEGINGTMLTKMQDRGERTQLTGIDMMEGKVVQITLPDIGLLLIDEVDWMEDACTQQLQRRLDEGWRILAVCPPNAQRRPDYILGRRKVRPE